MAEGGAVEKARNENSHACDELTSGSSQSPALDDTTGTNVAPGSTFGSNVSNAGTAWKN